MSQEETRLKFQVEGLREIKAEMNQVISDSLEGSKTLLSLNKSLLKNFKDQIKVLESRNELLKVSVSGQATSATSNSPTTGIGLVDISVQLNTIIEELKKSVNPSSSPETAGPTNPQTNIPNKNGLRGKDAKMMNKLLQGIGLASLINPLTGTDALDEIKNAGSTLGSSLMMMGGKMGFVGLGIVAGTKIATSQFDLLKNWDTNAQRTARALGGATTDYYNFGNNPYAGSLGYSRSDILNFRAGTVSALGRDSSLNTVQLMQNLRAFNFSEGDLYEYMKLGRGDKNFSLSGNIGRLMGSLRESGVPTDYVRSLVPEYLKILTEIGQQQLKETGEINQGVNTKMIAALAQSSKFQNPEILRTVVSSLYSGFQSAKTPQVEALQFQALSRVMPGAKLWDLELVQENPFSKTGSRYMNEFLKSLSENTPKEDLGRTFYLVFDRLSKNQAEELAKIYQSNPNLFAGELKKYYEEFNEKKTEQSALEITSRLDTTKALLEDIKTGIVTEKISGLLDDIVGLLGGSATPGSATAAGLNKSGFGMYNVVGGVALGHIIEKKALKDN